MHAGHEMCHANCPSGIKLSQYQGHNVTHSRSRINLRSIFVPNRGAILSKSGHSSPQASSLQSEVTEVEKDLTLRCLLWESLQEWQGLVDQWEATPFETLKIDAVQQDVTRFIQTVFLLEKGKVVYVMALYTACTEFLNDWKNLRSCKRFSSHRGSML